MLSNVREISKLIEKVAYLVIYLIRLKVFEVKSYSYFITYKEDLLESLISHVALHIYLSKKLRLYYMSCKK